VRLRLLLASERYAGRKSGSTLTTLSAHEKGTCADLRLAPAEGIHVVPNGIDITRFDLSSETRSRARGDLGVAAGDRLVLAVGRLSAEKGHAVLMRAFVELASDIADIRLIIAGDGPVKAALAKEAGGLIGQGRIYLPGTRTDVPELLAAADMFVLPSLYEGFGLAALEAMAAGLPVIATNVGGVPELVRDGTDGILVAPGDVGELKESIAALLVDPERAAALAAAARIRSREFTVDRMVEAYYGIYDAHAE
jgi:glycosyltransferase involved in cell wall biosynthesis